MDVSSSSYYAFVEVLEYLVSAHLDLHNQRLDSVDPRCPINSLCYTLVFSSFCYFL